MFTAEENISQEFRLKNIDKTKNYLIEEIKQNKSIIKKHKKVCKALNYIEHLLILASTVNEYVSITTITSLVYNPVGIASLAGETNICAVTAVIKKCISMIKKMKHDKILLLANDKLNAIEILSSKVLIYSSISHNKFVSVKNVLQEYEDMKK